MAEEPKEEVVSGLSNAAIGKALAGLTFRDNKQLPVLDDSTGKPIAGKFSYVPNPRPMKRDDVLSAVLDGKQVVIVAKDGSKHRVAA